MIGTKRGKANKKKDERYFKFHKMNRKIENAFISRLFRDFQLKTTKNVPK